MSAPDYAARERALDCTASFAVSAPAGSGKTELLIQRTLKLLSKATSPENVLAITFTRKAAAEMRERLVEALAEARANTNIESSHQQHTRDLANAALARDTEQGWELIENPGRLQIHTIDAFCRQIASQLCLDTGVSLPPNVAEKPGHLYLNAAEAMLDHLDRDTPTGEHLRYLCGQFDGNIGEVASLLADMLGSRDSWLPLVYDEQIVQQDYLETLLNQVIEDRVELLDELLQPFASDIEMLLDYALKNAADNPGTAKYLSEDLAPDYPLPSPEYLPQWKALIAFLCPKSLDKFRKSVNVQSGFPTAKDSADPEQADAQKNAFKALVETLSQLDDILPVMQRVQVLPQSELDEGRLAQSQALLQLLPTLAAEFRLQVQAGGETDYPDIAMTALQALRRDDRPTSLALRLDYRIDHILVDEFQDTASLQVQLLECLTDGWEPDDGRTLFIVGDGMQSIYSFRKANVSLFVRARQQGIGTVALEPLDLTANFRSDAQIVDWVNAQFSQIFKPKDTLSLGQVGFRHADSTRSASNHKVSARGFASHIEEAEALARDIAKKLETDDDNVALLVRSRPHLNDILPALRAQGLRWQAQKIDRLQDRMAVIDIHSLTRALCVPADRIAWLAVLRAPWAGLSNADLLHLSQWQPDAEAAKESGKEPMTIWEAICHASDNTHLSADAQTILTRLKQVFASSFAEFTQSSLRTVIEELWRALDGPAGLMNDEDLQDIDDYLDLLEADETAGIIQDWPLFEEKLADLYAKPRVDHKDENNSSDRLQIMTIHNAKGLEFDHVYLVGLSRSPRSDENPLLLYAEPENEQGALGYIVSAKPAAGREDDLYDYLKAERNRRAEEEIARLLYVGCTRAKKSLTLSCLVKFDDKGVLKSASSRSLVKPLWDELKDEFGDGVVPPIEGDSDQVLTLDYLRRLPLDRPLPSDLTELAQTKESSSDNGLFTVATNIRQRAIGTILHETLMQIVRQEVEQQMQNPTPADFESEWDRALRASGFQPGERQDAIAQLSESLGHMLSDKVGKWVLSTHHEDNQAEVAMDYLDQRGTLQRAVIDRTFVEISVDGERTRWVIDYKSSSPNEGETLEAFCARESEAYRSQMTRYAYLFNSDTSVKAMLYFPTARTHTEMELSSSSAP